MSSPQQAHAPTTLDRMAEYQAILGNLAEVSARRQNANTVYVGLNTVFLTALGVFMATRFGTWPGAIGAMIIGAVVTPINVFWRWALLRFDRHLIVMYDYLRDIEREFRTWHAPTGDRKPVGVFLKFQEVGIPRINDAQIELHLSAYLIWLYPVAVGAILLLTFLSQTHHIPPLSL
jgi:hypothetical protein